MKKILAILLLGVAVQAQSPLRIAPTGDNDRGPWGGASLLVDATRCEEFRLVMSSFHLTAEGTELVFEAVAKAPYIPRDSTATNMMARQQFTTDFSLEPNGSTPSNTFLAKLYRSAARRQYETGKRTAEGQSDFSMRNAHADLAAGYLVGNATKRANIQTAIEGILRKPEPFEL